MTVRITLQKDAYVGWNGRETPAREQVREFADHDVAADWLIHDSYFAEGYTRRMTWEVIDNATAPPPSVAAGAPTYATGGYVGPADGAWIREEIQAATDRAHALPAYARPTVTRPVFNGGQTDADLPGMWERADFLGGATDVVRTSGPLDPEIHAALVRSVERARREQERKDREEERYMDGGLYT